MCVKPPVGPGLYLIYSTEKGFWRPKMTGYTIWPGMAGIFTAAEINDRFGRFLSSHVAIFPASCMEASCDEFLHAVAERAAT